MSPRVRSPRFREAGSRIDSLGGVDLDAAPGEIFRILGPHGSCKSTLMRCVAGIAPDRARQPGDVVEVTRVRCPAAAAPVS